MASEHDQLNGDDDADLFGLDTDSEPEPEHEEYDYFSCTKD